MLAKGLHHPDASSVSSPSQASRTNVETRADQEVVDRSDPEVGHEDNEEPHIKVVVELLVEEEADKVALTDHVEPNSVLVEELVVDEDDVVEELANAVQDSSEAIPSSPAASACNA